MIALAEKPQAISLRATRDVLRQFAERARAPRLRSMRQFAEQEIVIPDGPFEGRRFNCDRQPYAKLWFDAVDSQLWNRFAAVGPTQSGKSLTCFIIPAMYHLFEIGETVICGLPTMEIAKDKWREDLLPAIEQSRYRDLLPRGGASSRGGTPESIQFINGVTLKFMSGGGSDKKRAAFTSRVLVVTEADDLDEASSTSREADKLKQMEARTKAYGDRKRIYLECTASLDTGRIWREYQQGTKSKIACLCPHCGLYVSPEREDFVGWQGADSEHQAADESSFFCPDCGEQWSTENRRDANRAAVLVHDGQEVTESGEVTGQPKRTMTLGFRWSAANNLFATEKSIGVDEWKAAKSEDEDNAEREQRQFVWALPYIPNIEEKTPLDTMVIANRTRHTPVGQAPDGCEFLTVGVDVGKWELHWTATAWEPNATGTVIDYGTVSVPSDVMSLESAIVEALNQLKMMCNRGWLFPLDVLMVPGQVWIDSGYEQDAVYKFCRDSGSPYFPVKGYGMTQRQNGKYRQQETAGRNTKYIGEEFHIKQVPKKRVLLTHLNSDYWKTWLHKRLDCSLQEPGAVALYKSTEKQHRVFAKHLTAEREVQRYDQKKAPVTVWERIRKANHWLDATSYSCAAAHRLGVRLGATEPDTEAVPTKEKTAAATPQEQPTEAKPRRFVRRPSSSFLKRG